MRWNFPEPRDAIGLPHGGIFDRKLGGRRSDSPTSRPDGLPTGRSIAGGSRAAYPRFYTLRRNRSDWLEGMLEGGAWGAQGREGAEGPRAGAALRSALGRLSRDTGLARSGPYGTAGTPDWLEGRGEEGRGQGPRTYHTTKRLTRKQSRTGYKSPISGNLRLLAS